MTATLILQQNLDDFEVFYDMLGDSHRGLDAGQGKMLNAEIVLLLSNHIGDVAVLRQAFALARVNVEKMLPR